MEQQLLTQKEVEEALDKKGLCLLSLDGGGVRGLSTLMILRTLMNRVNVGRSDRGQGPVKPCQLFDLIGGTSTGGYVFYFRIALSANRRVPSRLIAILLGRLQLDVDECIAVYTSIFEKIFKQKSHRLPISFKGKIQGRFDSKVLRTAIIDVIKARQVSVDDAFGAKNDRTCRT